MASNFNHHPNPQEALKAAVVKAIPAFQKRFFSNFTVPRNVLVDSFEIEEHFSYETQSAIIQLLYKVYISDEQSEIIKVPASWIDYIKHGIKMRWPKVGRKFKIEYKKINTVNRTIYPEIYPDHAVKMIHRYEDPFKNLMNLGIKEDHEN